MFTEDHHKILEEIAHRFSDTQTVADKVGLSVSLTHYLLEELSQYDFIVIAYAQIAGSLAVADTYLKPKGEAAVVSPSYFIGKQMNPQSSAPQKQQIFNSPVGVVANDRVQVSHFTQNNNTQNLTEAAQEIQTLIDQLTQSHPTTTMSEKVGFASAIVQQIDTNPSLSTRVLSASKAGGTAAIGQFLNHPLSSFIIAAIEDWQKTKNP
jgi:hypothetical protein